MNSNNDTLDKALKIPDASPAEEMNVIIEPISFKKSAVTGKRREFHFRPLTVSVLLTFLVLALITWFMFTARAVKFEIEPARAPFTIQGTWPTWELGGRYLMQPGTYAITAKQTGYYDLQETVTINAAADQSYAMIMSRLPGILTVTTEPQTDAELILDQQNMGRIPLTLDAVAAGLHDLSIISERYLTYDTQVDITGKRAHQSLTIELMPAWAAVEIASNPANADIIVDNEVVGKTPASIDILQGAREIKVKLSGYKIWNTRLQVRASENQSLPSVNLIKADGTLAIRSNPTGASITVSGQYKGNTPLDLKLAPGESYLVSLSKAGYQSNSQEVSIEPDQDIMLDLKLVAVLGVVQLVVTPDGGELFIDGKSYGEPSQRLSLIAQRHHLEIRKQGYATYATTITPRPGFDQRLQVNLKTVAQARTDSIPQTIVTASGQQMKFVVPAKMTLGASRREPGRRSNEIERQVALQRPFYISVFEVSNKEFIDFDVSHSSGMISRVLLDQQNRPVVNVSWEQAAAYCNWLSKRDGLPSAYIKAGGKWRALSPLNTGYRLPTEAEWAWVSRYAGMDKVLRFPWGDAMPPEKGSGNYADESARNLVNYYLTGYQDNYRGTAPLGSFSANPLGLYDLNGNVAEWMHDYYSTSLTPRGVVLIDPEGPAEGKSHVIRGSSFLHGRFSELRWTFRDYGNDGRDDVGFRIARYHEPVEANES
ncbi:MAG: PEGA domain-containing protein [Gammaproteobacteria bacterium]|nr:PEGA domain-containing protein [Gammaproteobacteria bacterium]